MKTINYEWDEKTNLSTRKNLQLPRRLFHMGNGLVIATLYHFSLTHQQMIHVLGTFACVVYVFEQIRISYPEFSSKFLPVTRFIMRAEEQLKESAMIPYIIAVLLTIITFPKVIALIAITTLAVADPLSAIFGIKYGKRKIVSHKSLEGSLAFFISTFVFSSFILTSYLPEKLGLNIFVSLLLSAAVSIFEMIPLKLDDNLTIPLFTAFTLWAISTGLGLPLY